MADKGGRYFKHLPLTQITINQINKQQIVVGGRLNSL